MEFEIHPRNGFIEAITHGDGDVAVFQQLLGGVLEHPDWEKGYGVLIDHSDLNTAPLTVGGMAALADMIKIARTDLGKSKMAIFVPDDLQYGLGRMWQVFVENKWDGASEIFRSKADAIRWLMDG